MKKLKLFLSLLTVMLIAAAFLGVIAYADSYLLEDVEVGDCLIIGNYEQDCYDDDGKEGIEWVVVDVQGNHALLCTAYVIDCKPYNDEKGETSWGASSIREWLNGEFYQDAFTDVEKECILETVVKNDISQQPSENKWEPVGSVDTKDKIFLLSYAEVTEYFAYADTEGTEYAKAQGAKGSATDWYTRSCGKSAKEATCMSKDLKPSSSAVNKKQGIMPAMWIDLNADWEAFPYARLTLAYEYEDSGDYLAAYTVADELGTYYAAEYTAVYNRFYYAIEALENGEYETALERFEAYKAYAGNHGVELAEEFNWYLPDCYYEMGIQSMETGNYEHAIEIFSTINSFEDTMEKLTECFDKTNVQYRYLSQNLGSVVNAGNGKGYSETNEIKGSDPHFGWALGKFLISGYTEVQDNNGTLTFIKTPGDDLVLWFDLDQDIDCLNGNEDLTIAEDKNGYDQAFGISKTNMGRGALLIRHTDYRNLDIVPVTYLDYLSASETGVANTRVEIKEEGEYEVALDYEITDSNLKHVLNKTNDYRITFKFTVKNGSGMFYMQDVDTGSELEDYSRTSEGFVIDLANSHSLQIDVKRYALNQEGTALDLRASAAANDGDEFTHSGYYEITCTNKETKETVTKHIFVGSKGELASYQEVSDLLSGF